MIAGPIESLVAKPFVNAIIDPSDAIGPLTEAAAWELRLIASTQIGTSDGLGFGCSHTR